MDFASHESLVLSRRQALRGGGALALGGLFAGTPMAAAIARTDPAASWPAVAKMVKSYVAERKVSGMIAGLGFGAGEADYVAAGRIAFGAKPAPVGPDSLFRIYSMTKPVTGIATAMLIDEGKLGLDQPLHEILPEFRTMQVQKTYDGSITDLEPANTAITIRHLLTHTAGLGYGIVQTGPIKEAYENAGIVPGKVTKLPLAEALRAGAPAKDLKTFAANLAKLPLVAQPGTRWSYSVGLDLLGRVIEVASGRKFDAFLKERIFDPCGMTSTWFRVSKSEIGRLTANYFIVRGLPLAVDPARQSVYLDEPEFPFGGAGLVSSTRDYDRFLQMLALGGRMGGKRVMSEAAVRLATSNLLPEGVITKETWVEGSGFGAGGRVGLGAQAGTFGWGGAAGTVAFVNVLNGLRATLMTQYMPADVYSVSSEFPAAVLADLSARAKAAA